MITLKCPGCGKAFKVKSQLAGKRVRCPNAECRSVCSIPDENDIEPPVTSLPRRQTGRGNDGSLGWGEAVRRKAATSRKPTKPTRRWFGSTWLLLGIGASAVSAVAVMLMVPLLGHQQTVAAPQAVPAPPDEFQSTVLPLVQNHCVNCHGGEKPDAGLSLTQFTDEKALLKKRKTWERVFEMVTAGEMPPADEQQPTPEAKARFLTWLDDKLHHLDCSQVTDPGRVTIRRLNRAEYNNTIRDLMGVSFRPADDFPSDDVGHGFDNIGDVLSLPPLLMEKYLNAAEAIAQQAILIFNPADPPRREFDRDSLHRSGVAHPHGDDAIILVSNGDFHVDYSFPRSGQYILRVNAAETPAGDEASKMEFRIDDKPVTVFEVKQREKKYGEFEFPLHMDRGNHKFSVAFLNDYYNESAPDKNRRDRNLLVRDAQIIGPTSIDESDYPSFHKAILASRPNEQKPLVEAARENLRPFLKRAFRRPATEEELSRFVRLAEQIASTGESFETAMQVAVTGVLVAPEFLFRVETDKNPNDPNDRHPLNDYEIASRLSYFLWSSMPDDELMSHADRGDLHTDAVLETQVKRMLVDPKSRALVENFAEQWLQLRILNEITPDPARFPDFNADLREDMKRETSHFFEYIMREDRSILEFLDGTYTFVNERLARHYALEGITGPEFRRVDMTGRNRAGLLTQASILTLTSNPDRTSPVKRGKWVMEVILNKPPPPPLPGAPPLADTAKAQPNLTLRQQLELHRQSSVCASCHKVMDQLGFGIENFDPIGRWRDTDLGQPLDVRGELPGGQSFQGPMELAAVLRSKQSEFADCLAEKMLTYGLGRGLEYYDRCATVKIAQALKDHDFKFSVLITEIVKSQPFRMRRGEDVPVAGTESSR